MTGQPKAFLFLGILCLLFFNLKALGQETAAYQHETPFYTQQVELSHDNDFLLFTDWYYTTGSFITYRVRLEDADTVKDHRQLEFGITQYYFTPSAIKETVVRLFDRPYAGYSGLYTRLGFWNKNRILEFALDIGVTGPLSGAEGFQRWFHSSGESANPRWLEQIENGFHGNVSLSYTREWQWAPNPFSVHFAWKPALAVGSRDIFLEQGALFTFGKRAPLESSMAHKRLGPVIPEFFFGIHFAYRYVLHDALLQGHVLGDSSTYTEDPVEHLFFYGIEGNYRKERMEYRLGYTFSSPRAPKTTVHTWVNITIARNF